MEEAFLQVKKSSTSFGGMQAIREVSLELDRGDILGVIGPSGSGKTTLVNLITGFVKRNSGEVFFKGGKISGLAPHKIADLGVTRTFQIMRPYHSLPAFKDLIIPLNSPRIRRSRGGDSGIKMAWPSIFRKRWASNGMLAFRIRSPPPLGYIKRFEVARCLALRPEVIICDEIYSGLSMAEIATMMPVIEKLQMEGMTIIMIEHRLRELFRLVNRAIVMNFGEELAEDTPGEVMANTEVREACLGTEAWSC